MPLGTFRLTGGILGSKAAGPHVHDAFGHDSSTQFGSARADPIAIAWSPPLGPACQRDATSKACLTFLTRISSSATSSDVGMR